MWILKTERYVNCVYRDAGQGNVVVGVVGVAPLLLLEAALVHGVQQHPVQRVQQLRLRWTQVEDGLLPENKITTGSQITAVKYKVHRQPWLDFMLLLSESLSAFPATEKSWNLVSDPANWILWYWGKYKSKCAVHQLVAPSAPVNKERGLFGGDNNARMSIVCCNE